MYFHGQQPYSGNILEIFKKIYEKMLLSLLTPSIKFALNKHFFIIIDTIIDTGKSPGMENSGEKKSGWEIPGGEKSGRRKVRRGKFRLRSRAKRRYRVLEGIDRLGDFLYF